MSSLVDVCFAAVHSGAKTKNKRCALVFVIVTNPTKLSASRLGCLVPASPAVSGASVAETGLNYFMGYQAP